MVVIVEGLTDDVVPDVCPVASQFSVGHGYVAANQCARDVAARRSFPQAKLYGAYALWAEAMVQNQKSGRW
jgi:hypothetical protein